MGSIWNKPDDTDLGPYNPADPPAKQFRTPVHAVALANDGLLYACDRTNDRIQVFKTDGTFVKETFIAKDTLGDGSTFDVALSRDPQQKYLYVADGSNMKVHVLRRDTLEVLTTFGDGAANPARSTQSIALLRTPKAISIQPKPIEDSGFKSFVFRGIAPVTKKDQGVVWPKHGS